MSLELAATMSGALGAVAPVFCVIGAGFAARRAGLMPESAWAAVNAFGYWLLYPAFLFSTVAKADFSGPDTARFLGAMLSGFALAGLFALCLRPLLRGGGPAFTSVFQAGTRWNGFVALASAPALFGDAGAALIALAFGPVVAFVNLMSVAVMARWGDNDVAPTVRGAVSETLRNPLVLGSLAGLAANVLGASAWLGPVGQGVDLIGRAAMPLALLCVGAALSFDGVARAPAHLAAGLGARLVVAPALMLAACIGWAVPPGMAAIAVLVASMPIAPASYVLARQMGGDAPLMAGLVTLTTLVALAAIPLWQAVTGLMASG